MKKLSSVRIYDKKNLLWDAKIEKKFEYVVSCKTIMFTGSYI